MGAPVLGKIIGSVIPFPGGALIGEMAGKMLASALGVEATPAAVNTALATMPNDVAIAKIKASEAEAVAKWPALAAMAKAQAEAETAQFQAQVDDVKSARARDVAIRTQPITGTNTRANVMLISVTVVLISVVIGLFWFRATLPDGIVAILNMICGSSLTLLGSAFNFEFGSSRGSAEKSQQQQSAMDALVKSATAP